MAGLHGLVRFDWQIGKEELSALARKLGWEEYINDPTRVAETTAKAAATLRERYKLVPIWNSGLTKEADGRVARLAAAVQEWYDNGGEPWNKGRTDCWQISENVKRQAREGNFHCIGDYNRGRTFDANHCEKLSERALKRTKIQCVHCDIIVSPAMHKRWHGDNCKQRKL